MSTNNVVYVVIDKKAYENDYICAIYASLDNAIKLVEKIINERLNDNNWDYCEYKLEPIDNNKPNNRSWVSENWDHMYIHEREVEP